MNASSTYGIVEQLDEMAYLDGCRPQTAHCVIETDDGVEVSDGRLYCRRCCWDVRGTPMAVTMDCEEEACHCDSCGCLLAYTLSAEAACRSAALLEEASARLHCDDRYHVARMLEACPGDEVLQVAIRTVAGFHGV
jgi:hypothetical protein